MVMLASYKYERLLSIVSPLVSKNQNQKLNKRSYLNDGVTCVFAYERSAYDKFPDIFHMGTFIDSTHMKL